MNSSVATLEKEQVQEGKAFVRFTQAAGSGLPNDSWLLRVYAGDTLIRTMGFVITNLPQPAAAAPEPPQFTNYTVVAGDTLQSVATKLKPPAEDTGAFTTRLLQANNLQPNATLNPGQVLRVPR